MLGRAHGYGGPYRATWMQAASPPSALRDADLAAISIVIWVGSVARVVMGVRQHASFGAELALAAIAVVALPLAALMKS